jgi:hypothetical protein
MRASSIRPLLVLTAFAIALQWSGPAFADFTGTVGEITLVSSNGAQYSYIRFKLTDPAQTATCAAYSQPNSYVVPAGYAFFDSTSIFYRELYAMLLVSKKGAPISCTANATVCMVTSCTLP